MPELQEKTRITIRLDSDLLAYFRKEAKDSEASEHPIGYQTAICEALREYIETQEYLQKVVREKLYTLVD